VAAAGALRRGLGHVLTLWRVMGERQLGLIAAGVGFFAMLAVFPALAALIALVSFWADPGVVRDALDLMAEFVPEDAFDIISDQTARLIGAAPGALGWASVISTLAAAWSARRGVGALVQGLNAIYGGQMRGGIGETLLVLALTGLLIGVGIIAVIAILLTPLLLALATPFLPAGSPIPQIAEVIRWAVSVSAVMVGLALFYRYGPNRPDGQRSPFLSPGLVLAMLVWSAASVGFTLFLSNFGNYNEVYGSIGAAIALLMWFYISAYAVLIGGALNYTLEKPAAPDPSQVG
jgi:membrane protein